MNDLPVGRVLEHGVLWSDRRRREGFLAVYVPTDVGHIRGDVDLEHLPHNLGRPPPTTGSTDGEPSVRHTTS